MNPRIKAALVVAVIVGSGLGSIASDTVAMVVGYSLVAIMFSAVVYMLYSSLVFEFEIAEKRKRYKRDGS